MAILQLEIHQFLEKTATCKVFDVRSPAEFDKGHIPGAINLPIFSNEERAIVGTLYKNQGKEQAILKGLELVGPKLKGFIQQVGKNTEGSEILIYCWRGGMRSSSMAWLMDMYGYKVYTLKKGYKAFRNFALNEFTIPRHFIILGGKTGSGKTEILHGMKQKGANLIDLEGLAHHKGSAFGAINESEPPTQEHFENLLAWQLFSLGNEKIIWLEDESQSIGRKIIPNPLFEQMRNSRLLFLDIPLKKRVERLVDEYGRFPKELLAESILRIKKRLGDKAFREALLALDEGRLDETASILLGYYDKTYMFGIHRRAKEKVLMFSPGEYNIEAIAEKCITIAENTGDE